MNKSVSMMDLQDSRMNSISNLNSVGDMLTSSQASIAGLGHSFGNLCGPLRMGGHMPAGSAGSGLRLSQMGHIGGPTESISQQQQQAAAAMHFPLSFQNPLFHLAAQNSPAQSQPPPPLLLAPEPENGHHDYQPAFGNNAFSRSEDLSGLRSQSSLVQPSIVHSHSYSDDFTRQNQSNDYAWHQLSLQVQVGISYLSSFIMQKQFYGCNDFAVSCFSQKSANMQRIQETRSVQYNFSVCDYKYAHNATLLWESLIQTFVKSSGQCSRVSFYRQRGDWHSHHRLICPSPINECATTGQK